MDQYCYAVKPETVSKFQDPDRPTPTELARFEVSGLNGRQDCELRYWRRHQGLQDWFRQEWIHWGEGDPKEEFNRIAFRIDLVVINRLARAVRSGVISGGLPVEFGHTAAKDLEFCQNARKSIRAGNTLYYYCDQQYRYR